MFSGIVECIGTIEEIQRNDTLYSLIIKSDVAMKLYQGQSIAVDGVCLTVTNITETCFTIQASIETLSKTIIKYYKPYQKVHIERAKRAGDYLDGHIVQGHVDMILPVLSYEEKENEQAILKIGLAERTMPYLVSKGSVCINGVSLTIAYLESSYFEVMIVPYTIQHTNLSLLQKNEYVNLEFDILGKYVYQSVNYLHGLSKK